MDLLFNKLVVEEVVDLMLLFDIVMLYVALLFYEQE